jgi:hypothetical protein
MISWFKKKSRIEKLKARYTCLMRKSFQTSLKNPEKSEKVHRQADKLLREIQYLSLKQADN